MGGQFWPYYERIGRGKKKKYKCLFNSCDYKLPTYQGIVSHVKRTHGREIDEAKRKAREWKEEQRREKQEEIAREKRAEEFAKQQLREFKKKLPQIKERMRREKEQKRLREEKERLEIKRQREQRRRKEEERRIEEKKMIEIWNEAQEEIERAKQQKENIKNLFAYYLVFEKEKPTLEDIYLYNLLA